MLTTKNGMENERLANMMNLSGIGINETRNGPRPARPRSRRCPALAARAADGEHADGVADGAQGGGFADGAQGAGARVGNAGIGSPAAPVRLTSRDHDTLTENAPGARAPAREKKFSGKRERPPTFAGGLLLDPSTGSGAS